jgi:hypothetical protein
MSVNAVEQFNPEVDHQQLRLDGDAFRAIVTLAEGGAITPVSLDLTDPDLPFESYEMLGAYLGRMNRSCSWWIGDWLVFGEGVYGERFAQAVTATGLSEQTLLNRAYVCRNVSREMRRANLPFSVHAEVAPLPPKEQRRWLDRAAEHNWTVKDLRSNMKHRRTDTPPPVTGDPDPDSDVLLEVAKAILRDARPAEDSQHHLIPNEDIARLRGVLGEDE